MTERFPAIEPYEQGMLDVGDGQRIYWETSGNPDGRAALVLHGGPGSGGTPGSRRNYDPTVYRIVVMDQRGAGRSTPHASEHDADMSVNTTAHLLADMELLREHLGIDRWLLWGGSWGVTLALTYAERYPDRVTAMVLASVTMTRPADVHWLYHGVGMFFPEEWRRFRSAVPEPDRDGDLVAAYDRLLNDPDPAVRQRAADEWCAWEQAVVSLEGMPPNPRYDDPRFRLGFARTVAHYFAHAAWLEDGQILRDAGRLAGIPGVLIHGRLDLGGPPETAWELAQAWPGATLHLVGSGHQGGPDMSDLMIDAIDRFSGL